MNFRLLFFIFLIFFVSGCGFFSKKVESIVEKEELNNTPVLKPTKKNLFCSESGKIQILLEDESTLKFYKNFSTTLFENKNFSFVQKAAMLSMLEMFRRPDVAPPSSRFQYFLRLNGKSYYQDFTSKDLNKAKGMPFIKGVEVLLKSIEKKELSTTLTTLDNIIPSTINVGPGLENFLQEHKTEISQNEELTEYFFKGDEILTRHESFKRHSFKKIYQQYINQKNYTDTLYTITDNDIHSIDSGTSDLALSCNLDINQETLTKSDIIQNKQTTRSHYFAIMDGANFFVGVSSSVLPSKLNNIAGTYFIDARSPLMPMPVCEYKNKIQDIILFSTKGRFPSQHLKHLLNYEIGQADSQQSLQELLTFSRHLFLSNPDRILYESKRGRKAQLDFFLSMNFPIYHVTALGDIIGAANFKNGQESRSLVLDDRSNARLKCGQ